MARRPAVTVLGSLNTDISLLVPHLPGPGETVLAAAGATFGAGGKGANQAVAAARLGAAAEMVGCCGDDEFGARLRAGLEAEGIGVAGLRAVPGVASGLALITVDPAGENSIAVAAGANALAGDAEVAAAFARPCDVLVLSAEIPVPALGAALRRARSQGVRTLLNLAPVTARRATPARGPGTTGRRMRWRGRGPSRRAWLRGSAAVTPWSRWARRERCWPGRRARPPCPGSG